MSLVNIIENSKTTASAQLFSSSELLHLQNFYNVFIYVIFW